jgi:hypothetical protein
MQIPRFWTEAREQHKSKVEGKTRSVTVRRMGWSSSSQADAQRHAQDRAGDALRRILGGEKLPRIEARVSYGGADGQPIREEIVEERDVGVITRNAYGANCLNTPDVLFADVDLETLGRTCRELLFSAGLIWLCFLALAIKLYFSSILASLVTLTLGTFLGLFGAIPLIHLYERALSFLRGTPWDQLRRSLRDFSKRNPDWHLRLYKTPAGARIMALHRTFDPNENATVDFFGRLRVDPIYRTMCERQRCFRARVSPKPWRIGMAQAISPRGVWRDEFAQDRFRIRWLADYSALAPKYASCSYVESFGSDRVDPKAAAVLAWHDELSQANSGKPIA